MNDETAISKFMHKEVYIATSAGTIETVVQDAMYDTMGHPITLYCGLTEIDAIIPWVSVCSIMLKGQRAEQMLPGVFPSGKRIDWREAWGFGKDEGWKDRTSDER